VTSTRPTLTLVLPIYNEEDVIPELHGRLQAFLATFDFESEVLFVNDGSRDRSMELLRGIAATEPRYRVLSFARNFGHQAAITAGVDYARGEAVVVMDADLQDPPHVILDMAAKWQEGYEVVYAVRQHRPGETRFKTVTATTFYGLLRRLASIEQTVDVGDFRMVDRKALDAFLSMREHNRYVRGMFSWIGFRQAAVPYDREPRRAGTSKYPLRKMIKFAADAFVGFSTAPLRFAMVGGFVIATIAVGYGLVAIALKLAGLPYVPGYASLLVTVAFLSGMQLMVMGMVGQYVARVYDEARGRPLYLVREARGFEAWTDFGTPDSRVDGFQRQTEPREGRPPLPMQWPSP
jgi:polyisoprenyl-phosphate glycosyltransferase